MRDLGIYTVLMLCGLGAAYWASMPSDEKAEKFVSLVAIEPKSVASVAYSSKDRSVVIQRRGDKFWVDIEEQKTRKVKEKGEDGKETTVEKVETESQSFLANAKFEDFLKDFNPLQAKRVIGVVGKDEEKEFGLAPDDASEKPAAPEQLVIKKSDGSEFSLTLGKKSYGSRNRFAREARENRVVLLDGKSFESVVRAEYRIFERNLVAVDWDDVTAVEVGDGKQSKRLSHTQRNKKGELQWAEDKEGATPKASYKSWMDKITRLRLTVYANKAEAAQAAAQPVALKLVLEKASKPADTLVVAETKGEGGKSSFWVRSEHLGTWAKVSSNKMAAIVKDIPNIVAP